MKRKAKSSQEELMMVKIIRGDASGREDSVLIIENESKQSTQEEEELLKEMEAIKMWCW